MPPSHCNENVDSFYPSNLLLPNVAFESTPAANLPITDYCPSTAPQHLCYSPNPQHEISLIGTSHLFGNHVSEFSTFVDWNSTANRLPIGEHPVSFNNVAVSNAAPQKTFTYSSPLQDQYGALDLASGWAFESFVHGDGFAPAYPAIDATQSQLTGTEMRGFNSNTHQLYHPAVDGQLAMNAILGLAVDLKSGSSQTIEIAQDMIETNPVLHMAGSSISE